MESQLRRLVYRSDALIAHDDVAAMDAIFKVSAKNNKRDGLTGALAQPDGKFVQVIEGKHRNVSQLLDRLRSDSRHENVTILGDWPIKARLFYGWAMARPDPTPLGQQDFRVVTETGSGAQVTHIMLGLVGDPLGKFLGV